MSEKLVGNDTTKNAGSWVYTQQGVASDKGFNHVSKYWYPKTMSYDEGLEHSERLKKTREDIKESRDAIDFEIVDDNGPKFRVHIQDRFYKPTEIAINQLCSKYGVPSRIYKALHEGDEEDLETLQYVMRNALRKQKEEDLLFRTYSDDNTLRAVLSDEYSIIPNTWYIKVLSKLIPGGRLSHFKFSDADTIYGNVLIPDNIREEPDSDYGGMLAISNSEIGTRTLNQRPSIFRAICMNGCIWGETKGDMISQRHIHINAKDLLKKISNNIQTQIPLLTIKTDDLIKTHNDKSDCVPQIFALIAKEHNLNKHVAATFINTWIKDANKEKSRFGVIDAITRAGQKLDADKYVRCDEIGGKLLNNNKVWQRYNSAGKHLSTEEFKKLVAC